MKNSLVKLYHKKLVADKKSDNKIFLNGRVFTTIDRFLKIFSGYTFSGKVLDLGCGDGSFVKYCKSKGVDAVGLDINNGIDLESSALPFRNEKFDIVYMGSVIEHIEHPSVMLSQIKRVLKKYGILVVITPNIDQCKFGFYNDPTHVKPYNPAGIAEIMAIFGFEKLAVVLWTVGKSSLIWRLPEKIQFLYGRLLPFSGLNKFAPNFLKGKSRTMLCAFRVNK
jgi:2-polyprenyl-3-methyl-5-hydroxy-6-metoxy-1,4-benzoquinol methylase